MASALKNLSDYTLKNVGDMSARRFAVVVAEWNSAITDALAEGAKKVLMAHGAEEKNILIHYVPGSFELPLGAQLMAERRKTDAVICLGCVIKGDTPHFEYVCAATAQGIMDVGLKYNKPVIFGVLTVDNEQQAQDRAGGVHGNKGEEAAITAIKMLGF